MHSIVLCVVATVLASFSVPGLVMQTVRVAPFSSVELRNGGKVRIRHGSSQSVNLVKGSTANTGITLNGGGRLVIDRCKFRCPRGYELEIEIVTPALVGISIAEGGLVQVSGSFLRQPTIVVDVNQGGTIDLRSMSVDNVTASVNDGGIILTKPRTAISASVVNGGNITYWGDAQVKSSIKRGGVVVKGTDQEADKPLSEFDVAVQPVTPITPLTPIRPPRK